MRLYEKLIVLLGLLLIVIAVDAAQADGPVDPASIISPSHGGQPAPAPQGIHTTSLDDLARPLDAVSISLDIAVARSAARGGDPAASNVTPAKGGQAASSNVSPARGRFN